MCGSTVWSDQKWLAGFVSTSFSFPRSRLENQQLSLEKVAL